MPQAYSSDNPPDDHQPRSLQQSSEQNSEGNQNQLISQANDSIIIHSAEQVTIHSPRPSSSSAQEIQGRPLIARSPYLGLRKFEIRDKDLFFGREQLIDRLLHRLEETPFLLILGASGSGKSSLVRAGLIPKLSEQLGVGFREFIFTPDRDPFDSFRASLHRRSSSTALKFESSDR